MEHRLLIWFCNPNANGGSIGEYAFDLTGPGQSSNVLSDDFWFEGDMVESLSISQDMMTNVEKTINMKVKNPLNFMADYDTIVKTDGNHVTTTPMGVVVPGDWDDVVVSDAEFIVFKGSHDDFLALDDTERTKALLGTFFVEKVTYDQVAQTFTIDGRDAMALAKRWAVWNKALKFPPKDAAVASEIYVGQIIHYLFHWIGCYHLHNNGVEDRTLIDKTDPVVKAADIPPVDQMYSTSMSFKATGSWPADEQIANNELVADVWNTFLQYTGYKIYVKDKMTTVNGFHAPKPVFCFEPPAYKLMTINNETTDDTANLFGYVQDGANQVWVNTLDRLFYAPTSTHWNPITVTGIVHTQDADPVRYAIKVQTKGRTVVHYDTQFVATKRMRAGRDRVGVVVEPDLNTIYGPQIADAILYQIRELYTNLQITWSDAIKFKPRLYTFDINECPKGINIRVNGVFQCIKNEISWSGTKYETSTAFSPTNILQADHSIIAPQLFCTPGETDTWLAWSLYDDVTKDGATAGYTYTLERYIVDPAKLTRSLDASQSVTGNNIIVSGLTNNTWYQFRIRAAHTWNGVSPWSNWCELKTCSVIENADGTKMWVNTPWDETAWTQIIPGGDRVVGKTVVEP